MKFVILQIQILGGFSLVSNVFVAEGSHEHVVVRALARHLSDL